MQLLITCAQTRSAEICHRMPKVWLISVLRSYERRSDSHTAEIVASVCSHQRWNDCALLWRVASLLQWAKLLKCAKSQDNFANRGTGPRKAALLCLLVPSRTCSDHERVTGRKWRISSPFAQAILSFLAFLAIITIAIVRKSRIRRRNAFEEDKSIVFWYCGALVQLISAAISH